MQPHTSAQISEIFRAPRKSKEICTIACGHIAQTNTEIYAKACGSMEPHAVPKAALRFWAMRRPASREIYAKACGSMESRAPAQFSLIFGAMRRPEKSGNLCQGLWLHGATRIGIDVLTLLGDVSPRTVGKSMPMLAAAWSHAWQHGATCVNTDFLTVLGDVSPRGIEKSMPTHVAASMQPHAST